MITSIANDTERSRVLANVHLARSLSDFRMEVATHLARLVPNGDAALLIATGDDVTAIAEVVHGERCPFVSGAVVDPGGWNEPGLRRVPMRYGIETIGELCYRGEVERPQADELEQLADQMTVAYVNLRLNVEALRTTEHYCASLQAFEEGIVLFQERDPEMVGARFLSLLESLLGTSIGALYLLEHTDDPSSALTLQQLHGLPEPMLEELFTRDGAWWPSSVVDHSIGIELRDPITDSFPRIDASRLPEAMTSIVHCPLRYYGVNVGIALAFNVPCHEPSFPLRLERARRLGELGAALFHRLALESESLKNREIETQLAIAAIIQRRLLPATAPQNRALSCAWQSRPAQVVGGDYIDLLDGERGEVHAIVADVSGHGIDSALLMASCRSGYRARCDRLEPEDLLAHMNTEVLRDVGDTGMFITAATLRFSADGRRCTYASAGHNPLLWYRAEQASVVELDSTGPSLGMFAGMSYRQAEIELAPGDVLLLYTDGIVEASNRQDEMYGEVRLEESFARIATASAPEILARIDADLREFLAGEACDDDLSITVIRVE